MKKKKQMPKIINTATFRAKIKVYMIVAVILATVGLFSFFYWVSKNSKEETVTQEYIQKGVVTPYVCKLVGADVEKDMFAVECFTK